MLQFFNKLQEDIIIRNQREQRARVNNQIQAPKVRLIDAKGDQVGIVSLSEALQSAESSGLDLVEISPDSDPPVCRVLDYGKYVFDMRQKQKERKKKQKQIQLKEIKFRPTTGEEDIRVKLRNLKKFLQHGDKVKITVRFRGREVVHHELGKQLLERVESELTELGTVESSPKFEGRQMVMVIAPKKS